MKTENSSWIPKQALPFLFWFGFETVPLCDAGCSGVGQAGLKLRDLPAFASQMLGLKVCTTITSLPTFELKTLLIFFLMIYLWTSPALQKACEVT